MNGDHNQNQSDSGWRKRQLALDKKAENARELGLDYEPDKTSEQKRPQNCGTGYCSCIECVMEPPQRMEAVRYAMQKTSPLITDEEWKALNEEE